MPVLTVIQSTEGSTNESRYFAYDESRPIGSPSAFGAVFQGYESDEQGARVGEEWAIKVGRDVNQGARFEREYHVLVGLFQQTQALFGIGATPDPVYFLADGADKRIPAIAMPLYFRPLIDELPAWLAAGNEALLLEVMITYAQVLSALKKVVMPDAETGYVCLDRKPDDLRWQEGRLVVIDWNVLRPNEPELVRAELSLFARTWYILLTGYEISLSLNAYDDHDWRTADAVALRGGGAGGANSDSTAFISVGLRALLASANASVYRTFDELLLDLQAWRDHSAQAQLHDAALFPVLSLSPQRVAAIAADLRWRQSRSPEASEERRTTLLVAQAQREALADVQASLEAIERDFLAGDDDGASRRVEALRPSNALQRTAISRWTEVLKAYRSPDISAEKRRFLRDQRADVQKVVERLQRPFQADAAAESIYPLEAASGAMGALLGEFAKESDPARSFKSLAAEASLRAFWHTAQIDPEQREDSLRDALKLRPLIPYVADLLDGIEIEMERLLQQMQTGGQAERAVSDQVDKVRQQVLAWLRQIVPDEIATAPITAMQQSWLEAEDALHAQSPKQAPGVLRDFLNRVAPFRLVVDTLSWLMGGGVSALSTAHQADDLVAQLGTEPQIADGVAAVLRQVIARKVKDQLLTVEAQFAKDGEANFFTAHRALTTLQGRDLAVWLTDDVRAQIDARVNKSQPYHDFFTWLIENPNRSKLDIVAQAQSLNLPLNEPPVMGYLPLALEESAALPQQLEAQVRRSANEQIDKLQKMNDTVRTADTTARAAADKVAQLTGTVDQSSKEVDIFKLRLEQVEKEIPSKLAPLEARIPELATQIGDQKTQHDDAVKKLSVEVAQAGRQARPFLIGAILLAGIAALIGIGSLLNASNTSGGLATLDSRAVAVNAELATQSVVSSAADAAVAALIEQNNRAVNERIQAQQAQIETLEGAILALSQPSATIAARIIEPQSPVAAVTLPADGEATTEMTAEVGAGTGENLTIPPLSPTDTPPPPSIPDLVTGLLPIILTAEDVNGRDIADAFKLYVGDASNLASTSLIGLEQLQAHPLLSDPTGTLIVIAQPEQRRLLLFPIMRVDADNAVTTFQYVDVQGTQQTFTPIAMPTETQIVLFRADEAVIQALNPALSARAGEGMVLGGYTLAQVDDQGRIVALYSEGQRIAFVQWQVEPPTAASLNIRNEPRLPGTQVVGIITANQVETYPLTADFSPEALAVLGENENVPTRALNDSIIAVAGDDGSGTTGHWILMDRGVDVTKDRFGWVFAATTTEKIESQQVSADAPMLQADNRLSIEPLAAR